jgi:anaerobic selenocysteine-containing dehydrogenase
MWEQIQSTGIWYQPNHRFAAWDGIFKTPTGKFEFFCTRIELAAKELAGGGPLDAALKKMGIHASRDEAFMPHYEAGTSEKGSGKYPLLMMPYALINLSSGRFPNPPYLNKTLLADQLLKKACFVQINPQTAAQYRLKQGDRAVVQSPKGRLTVRVDLFEGAMPGVVFFPRGFGHTGYDAYDRGKGANPNEIIDGGSDPLSGQAVWWNTRVTLVKV